VPSRLLDVLLDFQDCRLFSLLFIDVLVCVIH